MQGNSDTEVCFFLALTYGLTTDPVRALTKITARVEKARLEAGVAEPFRAAIAASDGEQLVVLRWTSPGFPTLQAPSLYHSHGPQTLHVGEGFGPGIGELEQLPDDAQLVVSEPLELHWSKRHWVEIPRGSIGVFRCGQEPVFQPVQLTT